MPEQHFENYQGPPRAVSCARLPFVLSLIVYTLSYTFGVFFFHVGAPQLDDAEECDG